MIPSRLIVLRRYVDREFAEADRDVLIEAGIRGSWRIRPALSWLVKKTWKLRSRFWESPTNQVR
jgi:hypothetical protein